jgi:hypothetical protein
VLTVVGCQSLRPNNNKSGSGAAPLDPLFGTAPPAPRPISQATTLPPASPSLTQPAPTSLTSNAALAGGTPAVLDRSRDLRINDSQPAPASNYGQAPGNANSWSGAVLQRPEPAGTLVPPAPSSPPVNTISSTLGPVMTFEQARAQLEARNVAWMRLDFARDQGDWHFSCAVPNAHNPTVSRTYEAHARDELDAIRAVLAQIDKEK